MKKYFSIALLLALMYGSGLRGQEISPLFDYWKYYSDHANVLYKHLSEIALHQLEKRSLEVSGLKSKEDWLERQREVRKRLDDIIGSFPEKTPLNPRVTGRLNGDGFHVEKIIYESQPGFFVTAAIFIPDNLQGKAPAVLYCSGHTFESFRSQVYQHMIINLVKKGNVVLAFDPVGQGERLQYLDEQGKNSIFRTPTHEHSYPGGQCFISGSSLAWYMIWDGIRSVDYLLTRPEVDPDRLGITGRSGGGTQSAYIAAFDPRIRVTAPECYMTGFEYIFKSIGPQDAEQNFPGFLEKELDLADLLEVRAPKPAIIISTTRDFFSIQGARDTYREVKKVYETLGQPGLVSMSEDDAEHETTLKNREALYSFFKEHLNFPGNVIDMEVTLYDPAELQVSGTGQVIPEFDGESVFSLNNKRSGLLFEKLDRQRRAGDVNPIDLKERIRDISGYTPPVTEGDPVFSGREIMDHSLLEKYLVPGGGNYYLPVLVMKPVTKQAEKAVVIFNPEGKEEEITGDSLALWFNKKGYHVILPDIAGFGELGPGYLTGDAYMEHTSYNQWFAGILTGKSPVGLRMADMRQLAKFAGEELSIKPGNLHAVSRDFLSADLLHAMAVNNDFNRIVLINPLVSYRSLIQNKKYHPRYIQSSVPDCVKDYDLPDLAALLAPERLFMIDVRDQNGDILQDPNNHRDIQVIKNSYPGNNRESHFQIRDSEGLSYEELLSEWLE
ncbi:MAG: acetylxylan esterase [Cyclobacteriaceae bacterium]|nr:acetylxylan esterase [Cyclobacteriaceae bacterium]